MKTTATLLADRLAQEFGISGDDVSAESAELNDIFSEQPPTLDEFIYGKNFLNFAASGVELGPIQYDFIRHFEQVLYPETYPLMASEWGDSWNPVRYVNELVAEWGK